MIPGVKDTVAGIVGSHEVAKQIDYQQLAQEHAELILQGKTSVEIARWIGDKLAIPSWKAGKFF